MKDDLVDQCARAMCEDDGADWSAKSFSETANGCFPEEQRDYWRGKAEVALAIARPAILEEAAKFVETGGTYPLTRASLAEGIRALVTTGQEGGR